ncbi:4-cresol dehydrogenase (hydroxylating) [Crossiella equi]|uniref:4-cresol dehydrogenase (Hydroxylating) n=1 Tax=Crossiella equi TaxID=130796 RepID=A0ABS5ANI9_9PSEU|nr:FAD-binding oxidoreductase [Crossiella equi]MBP2477759.1 4-cresol dehydrogenase (hydroxylating) [Crossiella equi]
MLGPNIGMFRSRTVLEVLRPRTPEEVQKIIATAAGASFHVYSTGRNWGLGSREPVRDGVVTLDLSGMDGIRALDTEQGFAVVEPGVTQARLAQALEGTDRIVNLTASSAHTSVVGNTLDRGVGLRGPRERDLLGLEVVLPDGELVRVGWWPGTGPAYAPGLGPSLLHAFVQSGLGVVTAAAVRLHPRPEAVRVLWLQFAPESLPAATALCRRWVRQGLAQNALRVYNPAAAVAYRGRPGEYLVHVCLDGAASAVAALSGIVAAEAAESGLFTAVWHSATPGLAEEDRRLAALVDDEYVGVPDPEDLLLTTKTGQPVEKMDERAGLVFFLPVVPLSGEMIARSEELLRDMHDRTGVRYGATYFTLDTEQTLAIIALRFEREEAEAARAHRALDGLYTVFAEAGFTMCRLDVDHADWAERLSPDPAARRLLDRVKAMLDPDGVIAPGRYH